MDDIRAKWSSTAFLNVNTYFFLFFWGFGTPFLLSHHLEKLCTFKFENGCSLIPDQLPLKNKILEMKNYRWFIFWYALSYCSIIIILKPLPTAVKLVAFLRFLLQEKIIFHQVHGNNIFNAFISKGLYINYVICKYIMLSGGLGPPW